MFKPLEYIIILQLTEEKNSGNNITSYPYSSLYLF